jgi:hypothetical protein
MPFHDPNKPPRFAATQQEHPMNKHLLANAKAYASLLGAILTAVSTSYDSKVLTAIIAVLAAVVVWSVPNSDAE